MYSYFFGQHSIRKYLEKGVFIINQEEEAPIPPPGNKKRYRSFNFEYLLSSFGNLPHEPQHRSRMEDRF